MWAVDRNITKTYIEDVLEGVNAYLRHLRTVGAIINGQAWADPELNTPDQSCDPRPTYAHEATTH
jgi:phage tail sheath protein FI